MINRYQKTYNDFVKRVAQILIDMGHIIPEYLANAIDGLDANVWDIRAIINIYLHERFNDTEIFEKPYYIKKLLSDKNISKYNNYDYISEIIMEMIWDELDDNETYREMFDDLYDINSIVNKYDYGGGGYEFKIQLINDIVKELMIKCQNNKVKESVYTKSDRILLESLVEKYGTKDVKRAINRLNESIHEGPMHLYEIIHVLVKEYNMRWLTAKEHPEFSKFLPYSKIEDLDVNETLKSNKSAISISAGANEKLVGLALKYITTDGKLKSIDWTSMSDGTLQNLTICLRKILNDVEVAIEKEYTKHPKAKDLESAIRDYVRRQTPRNFYLRRIEVGVKTRELTKNDKQEGFTCIIDIEICPRDPQSRLSIGIDKNDCLRWTSQFAYHCQDGLLTPQHLIKWEQVEGKVATLLNSY